MERLLTHTVDIGGTPVGGDAPIRIQSMTNTPTGDVKATVRQTLRLIEAGAAYVRMTVPTMNDVTALEQIKREIRKAGFDTPLIADVHFSPDIAEAAARIVEKVRINPGNYVDRHHRDHIDFTEAEYQEETDRIRLRLRPLLAICRQYGTALRIGSNHGSLSDRIISRYGDTPLGMAASAMEFVRICEDEQFDRIVLSMKASNPFVMAEATRLTVAAMQQNGTVYPIHLGVTEAGAGEEGRIKSAVGIASLLADGIGDTVRVSLTEDPVAEIPAAQQIVAYMQRGMAGTATTETLPFRPEDDDRIYFRTTSAATESINKCSFTGAPVSATSAVTAADAVFHKRYPAPAENMYLQAACDFGPLLLKGEGNGLWLETDDPAVSSEDLRRWSLAILQACRRRTSRAEFISCPSCGRTQFDIAETAARIRQCTGHLKGLKIAVMGCIVNGPGEMADADYGYVGEQRGLVTLYRKREVVRRHVPADEAVGALIGLIKANGDWQEEEKVQTT